MHSEYTETNEAAPIKAAITTKSYLLLVQLAKIFGTPLFLIWILFFSIVPIIQLGLGFYYSKECSIDQHIPTYMITASTSGLVFVVFASVLIISLMHFKSSSTISFAFMTSNCSIYLSLAATILMLFFIFIWIIVGCLWISSVQSQVQIKDRFKANYCHPILYQWTFALLIITILWESILCYLIFS